MKNFEIFPNGGANFFDVVFHLSIGKAVMNASRIWQLRKDSLTGIGLGATVFVVAFPYFYKATFLPLSWSSFSL
jgi:hypothetical protein